MKSKSAFFCFVFFLNLFCFASSAIGPSKLQSKAERLYNEFQYALAAEIYQKLTDTSKPELKDMEHLAECYKKMNKYEDAQIWYARIAEDPACSVENLLNYGEILKANANYTKAKKIFQSYISKTRDRKKVAVSMAGCDSAKVWISRPTNYVITNQEQVNTKQSEFAVFPDGNDRVFFTGEPLLTDKRNKYGWTGNAFLRIFTAARQPDNTLVSSSISDLEFNKEPYHVGPVSSNKSGSIFFITRTYPGKSNSTTVINGNTYHTQNMELYIQARVYGKWQQPVPFAYNNVDKYSLGHAVLSIDEKTLYFVSDMPGGYGGTDIWYSELLSDGTWGPVQNAGGTINTPGNELFPSIGPDGSLYFSSDGLPGMGGLDIFCSKGAGNQWSKPVNLKYPINSPGDDFAYCADVSNDRGYLSSNRSNGMGGDDIYSFDLLKSDAALTVVGMAFDKKTGRALPGANITLYDPNNTIAVRQDSKPDGSFEFQLSKPDVYLLHGSKQSYYPDTLSIGLKKLSANDTVRVALYMDPLLEKGKTFRLKPIFYDFDKFNIRKDASVILDELVRTLYENSTLKIELASHTDSRGSNEYNLNLSQKRAQSVVDYLVGRGISRDRLVAKGYGETRLINKCADGVDCSEAEHQENRRTEFTVLSW